MTAHAARFNAYHSLSPELKAIGVCVEQIILRKWFSCIRMLHVVDLRVLRQPAWSESLRARTQFGGFCLSNRCLSRGTPLRYSPSLLSFLPTSFTWLTYQTGKLHIRPVLSHVVRTHAHRSKRIVFVQRQRRINVDGRALDARRSHRLGLLEIELVNLDVYMPRVRLNLDCLCTATCWQAPWKHAVQAYHFSHISLCRFWPQFSLIHFSPAKSRT